MPDHFLVLVVSGTVTAAAAPLAVRAARRAGLMDEPNARSSHAVAVPRSGGVAVALGVLAGLLVASRQVDPQELGILVFAFGLAAVGLVDDRRALLPLPRLAAQLATGSLGGAALGGGWLVLVGAVLLPLVVNSVNFMDGINGITALNVTLWGAVTFAVGLGNHDRLLTTAGAVCLGAALGFLPFNLPSARLFLGDTGTYLFGGLIGLCLLHAIAARHHPQLLAAPLAIYIADVMVTLGRRAVRGASLTSPHREHTYQRLVSDCGWPHPAAAVLSAAMAGVVTGGWALLSWWAASALTVVACCSFLALPLGSASARRVASTVAGQSTFPLRRSSR